MSVIEKVDRTEYLKILWKEIMIGEEKMLEIHILIDCKSSNENLHIETKVKMVCCG